jgi:DNA-binding response OmpR family regulator
MTPIHNNVILVVDDEPYILRSLSFVLEREGYTVVTAADGESGLRKIRELRPALVFLDIMLPRRNGPGPGRYSCCHAEC